MVPETVREAARRFGDAPVFADGDLRVLTYAQLDAHSDAVARGLARAGIGDGAVVALTLPSGNDYVVTHVAAAKLGAVSAGVNPALSPVERDRALAVIGPDLVISAAEEVDALAGAGPEPGPLHSDPDRPVVIVLTSGTTGVPKGATFTNRQLDAIATIDGTREWSPTSGPAAINGTPFAHVGFMTKLVGHLRRGGVMHALRRWRAPDVLDLIERHRVPIVGGVPAQVALMLRDPSIAGGDFSCVTGVVIGAGPSTPALVRDARARFGAPVSVRYSSTETGGVGAGTAFDAPDDDAEVSVGHARPGVEIALVDDEICVRSGAVMAGYWRDDDATRAAFTADGYVRTGDLGRYDDRGRLVVVGRRKEMYIRGGYNVFPVEVEAALSTHALVAAIAVAPRPDPVMGEIGVAVVVPRTSAPPLTLSDLRAHGAGALARYKLPDDLVLVDALPLTAMGKLDRAALRALVRAHPQG